MYNNNRYYKQLGKPINRQRFHTIPLKFNWQRKNPKSHQRLLYRSNKKQGCDFLSDRQRGPVPYRKDNEI